MNDSTDLVWTGDSERIVLSPSAGGRIVSWNQAGAERVHPIVLYEGGLLRVLFAEEQYPGSNFVTPHRVIDWQTGPDGFRAHLRHYWNTANWFMRAAGWPEKTNEVHFDDLVLDKIVTYDRARCCLIGDVTITNVSQETRYVTPWVHLSFNPWPANQWIVVDGKREPYADTEIYWGAHRAKPGTSMRMVHGDAAGNLFAVLGAATDHLRGMSGMLPVPGEFHQSASELRYDTVEIPPGSRLTSNCFLALTPDWSRWAKDAPVELSSRVEPAAGFCGPVNSAALLEQWMLPEERDRGLMVLSFLDKPPFYSAARYSAAHGFAGFHAAGGGAIAHVTLYAPRNLAGLTAEVAGGGDHWRLQLENGEPHRQITAHLHAHDFLRLSLLGPGDLHGKDAVTVTLTVPGQPPVTMRVPAEAAVEPRYPYQARQGPVYLELRHREKLGPKPAATADEIWAWQRRIRDRWRQWLEFNAAGPCDLEPRLVERQEGPTCIREKWLIQTEPGIWVPGYLVRPKHARGRLPVVYFLHGSGPGKDGFAGDEMVSPPQTMLGHELEYMPYRLANQLGCIVYVPDGRGQGELGETDPGRWTARMEALGVDNASLRLWDQVRALDWLVQRDDVDPARVGSVGCSGGGGLTYVFAAVDERVAASIAASTASACPMRPAPPGYFHRMFADRSLRLEPHGIAPVAGAPAGLLIAPRPLWIMDGRDDLGIPAEKRPEWRRTMQEGRDAIRRVYETLGAGDRYVDTWFEGGHCAGITRANVTGWFRKWFEK